MGRGGWFLASDTRKDENRAVARGTSGTEPLYLFMNESQRCGGYKFNVRPIFYEIRQNFEIFDFSGVQG